MLIAKLFRKRGSFKVNQELAVSKVIIPAHDIGSLDLNEELALYPAANKWLTSLFDCKLFGKISFNYSLVPLPNRIT